MTNPESKVHHYGCECGECIPITSAREERIRRSLEALNAPQPITLTREQWVEIVEEIEDDDDQP